MNGHPPRRLATIAGITIRFHASWLIILVLIAASLGDLFATTNPGWGSVTVWVAALLTTILFFLSVVLHELSHSLVARAHGLEVKAITLFVFGGISELPREPEKASTEFRIALAGPAASVAIGLVCWGLAQAGRPGAPPTVVLDWLARINILLAVFNLLPGFPLDGGRVLRAILWGTSGDFIQATRRATQIGKVMAMLFILWGVLRFFQGAGLGGLWLAFIGWFLLTAAEQSWRQVEMQTALASYTVRDLESPFFPRLPLDSTLSDYWETLQEKHLYRPSLVMDGDRLVGLVHPSDLAKAPRDAWPTTPLRQVMTPRARLVTTSPGEGLMGALTKMAASGVGQLPVLEGDELVGVIRRDRIVELLQRELAARHG